jgi:hypothetical protein
MKKVEDISLNHSLNNLLNSEVTGNIQKSDEAYAQIKSFQSSFRQITRSPEMIRLMLQLEFNFTGIVDASSMTAKEKRKSLNSEWFDSSFVIVDYSNVEAWLDKCLHEGERGRTVVALIPARTSTCWFHDIVLEQAKEIRFVKGRVTINEKQNSLPDALVIFHSVPNKRPRRDESTTAVLMMNSDLAGNTGYSSKFV